MRETYTFNENELINDSLEEDEKELAKAYLGKFTLKTMNFGEKNEAQFKAVKVNANNPDASELDPWKFRFYSLLYSIEEAPGFGTRAIDGWLPKQFKGLESYIYKAPDFVGEKLMLISDRVNKFSERSQKNLDRRPDEPSEVVKE